MTPSISRRGLILSSTAAAAAAAFTEALFAESPSRSSRASVSLTYRPLPLKLAHTWTIARGSSDEKKNGLLTLAAEGVTGYGEAAANKRWNQSYETSEAAFGRVKAAVAGLSPWEHLTWLERAEKEAGPDTEVVAALDLALWDWKGKRLNRPVHELLGVPRGRMPVTTFSIGIDTAEVMKQKVREASAFPKLKIKLGLPNDEENIAAIRSCRFLFLWMRSTCLSPSNMPKHATLPTWVFILLRGHGLPWLGQIQLEPRARQSPQRAVRNGPLFCWRPQRNT